MFQPFQFSVAMSVPAWAPANFKFVSVLQVMAPGTGAPNRLYVDVVVFLVSISPPMPRTHTPPPSWFGLGLPGAPTKAVDWVRKAVFSVLMLETRLLTAAPWAMPAKLNGAPPSASAPRGPPVPVHW